MELLPDELLQKICLEMEDPDINMLIRSGKIYSEACSEILNKRKDLKLQHYIKKYGEDDPKLKKLITTLFNDQAPGDTYFKIVIPRDEFIAPRDSDFLFFKGNFSRALFKIADYLLDNVNVLDERYRDITKINIFSEALYRGIQSIQTDLNNPEDIMALFTDYGIKEIGVEEFDSLPQIRVL